jgi:hypothetical protein
MTTANTVLLLSGWAGSGKDAAAALLVEEMNFTRVAFADGLKEDVSKETGIPIAFFHDKYHKDTPVEGVTPRDHLLRHALAVRKSDPDAYSRRVAETIHTYDDQRFVVSDWRYKREYEHLRTILNPNITVLRGRIQRPGITPSNDPSEHDLDEESFDFTIQNDGCISDLRDSLKALMRQIP